MGHYLTRIIFTLLATSLLAVSCVTAGQAGHDSKDNIYFKDQAAADARLAAFDTENPKCQLWTNWQKMCSRTGPDGTDIFCSIDDMHPSKPTRPFCVGDLDGHYLIEDHRRDLGDVQLLHLFCEEFETVDGKRRCTKLNSDRPFNGSNLAALRHPYCEVWSTEKGPVCSETGKFPEFPKCSTVDHIDYGKGALFCASQICLQAASDAKV